MARPRAGYHIPRVDPAFFDFETDLLRRMTVEQKLHALDALRRSARLAEELGARLRSASPPVPGGSDINRPGHEPT